MDTFSSSEIMEIITLLESSIDIQYQIWITVTFAFIVATFISRGQLPKLVLFIAITLYASVVLALFYRWVTDGDRAVMLIQELSIRGIDFGASDIAFYLRILTFTIGSLTAIFLSIYFTKSEKLKIEAS